MRSCVDIRGAVGYCRVLGRIFGSFWASNQMADEQADSIEGTSVEDDGLQEHIAQWIGVLDRWVKGVDLGMGRHDGDPGSPDGDARDGGDGR